jgi:hypothetical protein
LTVLGRAIARRGVCKEELLSEFIDSSIDVGEHDDAAPMPSVEGKVGGVARPSCRSSG